VDGLNDLSAADVNAQVDSALLDYDGPTKAEMDAGFAALNNLSAADVNAQVDTALADIHLDHLFAANYDPAAKPGVATALLNELIESDAGVSRFTANALEQAPSVGGGGDATEAKQDTIIATLGDIQGATFNTSTDSLEAIRDRGDAAWTTGAGGSAPTAAEIADAVWDETLADHLAAGSTGNALNAAGSAGDPWATTLPGSYTGSQAGKILDDILTDTADLQANQGNWLTATGFATSGDIAALNDFDPATEGVNVTQIDSSTEAAQDLAASAGTIVRAQAAAGTLTTTAMTTNLTEATDDHYNGRIIIWTSGVLQDQATNITDYNGATKELTFTAVTEAPTAGDTFVIV